MNVNPKIGKLEIKKTVINEQKTYTPSKDIEDKASAILEKKEKMEEKHVNDETEAE